MIDPSVLPVCTSTPPGGMDVRVQLAIVTMIGGLLTVLITLLQTIVMERIRRRQTKRAQAELPKLVARGIESVRPDHASDPTTQPHKRPLVPERASPDPSDSGDG